MDKNTIKNNFKYHPPKNPQQAQKYVDIRTAGMQVTMIINQLCPDSREKSIAITKLEEAVMWANASIARNE